MSEPRPGLSVVPGGVPEDIPYLVLPSPEALFSARAARLRQLAEGHAAGDWLRALAGLCDGQRAALSALGQLEGFPDGGALPLEAAGLVRPDAWREALLRILDGQRELAWPDPARQAMRALSVASRDRLERLADAVLGIEPGESPQPVKPDEPVEVDPAQAVFVGAALQCLFVSLAARLRAPAVMRLPVDGTDGGCPVCGMPPVAGLVRGDDKVRYLGCCLCGTAWHRVRAQCTRCGGSRDLTYLVVEGAPAVAAGCKAEACGECQTYLKLFYQEERAGCVLDADDAATLPLDLAVGLAPEGAFAPFGRNLLAGR